MAKNKMTPLDHVVAWLLAVGGLVHGWTAVSGSNLLNMLGDPIARVVMGLVGAAGVVALFRLIMALRD